MEYLHQTARQLERLIHHNSHYTLHTKDPETIARILRPYNIRVAHKPMFNLRRVLTNAKGKDKPEVRPGAVYKIECSSCQATYIGFYNNLKA